MDERTAWPLTYRKGDATIRTGDDDEMIADLYLTEDQEYLGPLLAAAPDLLAALDELVTLATPNIYPQPDKPDSPWAKLTRARAALTKARANG